MSEDEVANQMNEYDYTGSLHNSYLEKVKTELDTINTQDELSTLVYNLIKADIENSDEEQDNFIKNQIITCTSIEGCQPNLDAFSNNGKSLYNQLLNSINSCEDNSESCLSTIINQIKEVESEVLSASLEDKEKTILLISASIGRYSLHYWFYHANEWIEQKGGYTAEFSWKQLGRVDLQSGGCAGTVGAIAGGSISLGTLAVPSWVAGAVGGAVGGSLGNAIGQLFGW